MDAPFMRKLKWISCGQISMEQGSSQVTWRGLPEYWALVKVWVIWSWQKACPTKHTRSQKDVITRDSMYFSTDLLKWSTLHLPSSTTTESTWKAIFPLTNEGPLLSIWHNTTLCCTNKVKKIKCMFFKSLTSCILLSMGNHGLFARPRI